MHRAIPVLHPALITAATLLFWALRIAYWSVTEEAPMSDLRGYMELGSNVLDSWTFDQDEFWKSYKPPTLPILIAGVFGVFGDRNLDAWRICQTIFLFGSLLWAWRELARASGRAWVGHVLLFSVALSKPSIFWSYKIGTESVAEAIGYLCLALSFRVLRRPSMALLFLLGGLFTASFLNRPQFVIVLPVFLLVLPYALVRSDNGLRTRSGALKLTAVFLLGSLTLWSPWLVRGYRLYGHVVPLSTQGPTSFLWELGAVTIETEDGEQLTRDRIQLQDEAPRLFENDYQAMVHANRFVKAWLARNWGNYPGIVGNRIWRTITVRDIYLTRVSRRKLLPSFWNSLLIDKTPVLLIAGALGLLLIPLLLGSMWLVVVGIGIAPWLFGTLFLGYARILEPNIPLILFGNVAWPLLALLLVARLRMKRAPASGQGEAGRVPDVRVSCRGTRASP